MNPSKTPLLKTPPKLPRLSGWLAVTLALLACVWAIAPQQLPVSLYKLSLVTLAAVVGYWIDRSLFPYARPDMFLPVDDADKVVVEEGLVGFTLLQGSSFDKSRLMSAAMLRRAIIVGCAMLAMGLGA